MNFEDAQESETDVLSAYRIESGDLFLMPTWNPPSGYLEAEWLLVSERSLGFVLLSLS